MISARPQATRQVLHAVSLSVLSEITVTMTAKLKDKMATIRKL